jgi:hypothetical protein
MIKPLPGAMEQSGQSKRTVRFFIAAKLTGGVADVTGNLPGVSQRFSEGFLKRLTAKILADDLALPIQ